MAKVWIDDAPIAVNPGTRARRDLVTNPAYTELKLIIREIEKRESDNAISVAQGGDLHKANVQAGIVEGIQRVLIRLDSYEKDTLDANKTHV